MFEQYVRQLKSDNALDRRQAIVKITNSGHPDALTLLEKYLPIERDSAVKALIQKAVDYLRTNRPAPEPATASGGYGGAGGKRTTGTGGSNVPPSYGNMPPSPEITMKPPKPLSEQQKRMAKGRLDSAMQHQMAGNTEKAILDLRRALEINPDLKRDSFAHGLASQLTGGGTGDPFALLESSSKPKQDNIVAQGAETLVAFVLEVLIIALVITVFLTISFRKFGEIADAFLQYAYANGLEGTDALRVLASNIYVDQRQVFISSIGQGLASIIGLLMYSMFMYAVGIFIGGSGGVLNFLRSIMRVNAGIYLAIGVVIFAIPAAQWIPTVGAEGVPNFAPYTLLIGILVIGFFLYVYFAGRAHGFGFGKGCAMVFLTGIVISCFSTILVMLGGSALNFELTGSTILLFR
jgi:hypothetical protein